MLGGKLCDGKSVDVQISTCYNSTIDDTMNDAIENVSQAGICIYVYYIIIGYLFICM